MTVDYRILVTGTRETTTRQDIYVAKKLARFSRRALLVGKRVIVVEGRCPKGGVDLAAQRWAEVALRRGWNVVNEGHPADWDTYGKRAGNLRNTEMVELGANICLAFPGPASSGTWDCLIKAAKAGIPVKIYPLMEK